MFILFTISLTTCHKKGTIPFLSAAHMKDENGKPYFPDTFGGGIGVERILYAILRGGGKIDKIDDITCFGKNPDSFPMFLFQVVVLILL